MTPAARRSAVHAFGRRSLLIFTGAAGLALAGCTDTPLVPRPGPDRPQTPTPTPLPGTVDGAATEKELADYADALLARHRAKLADGERRLIAQLRDAHLNHLAVLTSTAPFDLPRPAPSGSAAPPSPGASGSASPASTTPVPSPSASTPATPSATPSTSISASPAKAIRAFAALEAAAGKKHRARALRPGGPDDQLEELALLWGSLSAAAVSYGSALTDGRDPAAEPAGSQRVAIALPDPADAAKNLLEQCYATIFGYQTALAELSDRQADHARSSLARYRDLRDRLVRELLARDQQPPAPHAGYRLPLQPTSASRSARLLGLIDTAVLPYIGQWLATTDHRSIALSTMINSTRDVLAWTSTITVWPGWPTQD